jgi:hypothetical protein
MEGCHDIGVLAIDNSAVANVNIAWLPKITLLVVRPIDESAVSSNSHRNELL